MSSSTTSILAPAIAIDSDYFDHLLVTIANLGIPNSCAGMSVRLRSLADDLDAIARGRSPEVDVLARAPILSEWCFFAAPGGVRLMGVVEGHREAGPGPILTSTLYAVDPKLEWARTLSRFYRLGDCARPQVPNPSELH